MTYSSCRLQPLSANPELKSIHFIPGRYKQFFIDYQIYKRKLPLESLEPPTPFVENELREAYPHIDFSLPWIVEFCSGTGEFLIDLSGRFPQYLFIGVEVALPCIQRALRKVTGNPTNLLFYNGESMDFITHDFQYFDFYIMMINFPDPWPKKRHLKRRIISTDFITACREKLIPEGSLHTATDVESLHLYHREIIDPLLTPMTLGKDCPVAEFYHTPSRYQEKNLSHSPQVFYTHHRRGNPLPNQ